jgi:spermidine synthase
MIVVVGMHGILYSNMLEKLLHGPRFHSKPRFNHMVQNRSGIITVQPDPHGDIVYGGGGYDGRFNLDPVLDSNGIRRGYMIAALHANPVDVLEIGLSSASWAWVLAAYDKIKRLTIVEINPGYPQIIALYDDDHQAVLVNPKVALHFDDGRRWLNRHPDQRFDFILMNTTFHWRSNITNLVSQEFLGLAKQHLKPGGVIYYNTTGSPDIIYTAARVFRHVITYGTFVAASDAPFVLTEEQKLANFSAFHDRGTPLFDASRLAWQEAAVAMARTALP